MNSILMTPAWILVGLLYSIKVPFIHSCFLIYVFIFDYCKILRGADLCTYVDLLGLLASQRYLLRRVTWWRKKCGYTVRVDYIL
jgi:hypothetical protein